MNPVQKICICGAGTMGSGIAQVSALSGFYTVLYEMNEAALENAKSIITKNLETLVEKGKIISEKKQAALQNIRFTNNLVECTGEVIIEAIIEEPGAKISLFNQLAEINQGQTIFASNTSSLSLTQIGMHFFNPAPMMKLVEVIKTNFTNENTTGIITGLVKAMGKTPVICKDSPGFIVNRVARPYYIESLRLVE